MATAPRPGRKGGRVSGGGTTDGAATISPSLSPEKPDKDTVTPPSGVQTSDGGLPSFLGGSLLQFSADASSHVAQGVVRGRGYSVPVQEQETTQDTAKVEEALEGFFLSLSNSIKAGTNTPVVKSAGGVPLHLLGKDKCRILLIEEDEKYLAIEKILADNGGAMLKDEKGEAPKGVLLVVPQLTNEVKEQLSQRFNDGDKKTGAGGGDKFGVWSFDSLHGTMDTKVWVCEQSSFLLFLSNNNNSANPNTPPDSRDLSCFSHIVLANFGSSASIGCEGIYALLKDALLRPHNSKVNAIICGVEGQLPLMSKFFEPVAVCHQPICPPGNGHKVVEFDAEQGAILSKLASVKVHSSGSVDDKASQALPHPKVMERIYRQAISLIQRLVSEANKKGPKEIGYLNIVVVGGDFHFVLNAIEGNEAAATPSNEDSPTKTTASSSGKITSVTTHMSLDAEALATPAHKSHHNIIFLTHAPKDGIPATTPIAAVIDLGTEKVTFVPSKVEALLPCRRVEFECKEERDARRKMCGWVSPTLYVNFLVDTDVKKMQDSKPHHSSLGIADNTVLQLCRNAFNPYQVLTASPHAIDTAVVEGSLMTLAEDCAIGAPDDPALTFLGELLARVGLPIDASLLVSFGVTCGLEHLSVITAVLSRLSLRGQHPPSDSTITKEDWQKKCIESLKSFSSAYGQFSDLLADVSLYIELAQSYHDLFQKHDKSDDAAIRKAMEPLASKHCVSLDNFFNARDEVERVLCKISDYVFITSPTPNELKASLQQNANILVYLLSAALSRKAVLVKSDGSVTQKPSTGSLMFIRSSKDVESHGFLPTKVPWSVGSVMIPTVVHNTSNKVYISGTTLIQSSTFFAVLLLLYPSIEFSGMSLYQEEESILFSLSINKQTKRFRTDVATAAKIMEFRTKWNEGLGAAQVHRCLHAHMSNTQILTVLKSKDKKFDLLKSQEFLTKELAELISTATIKEYDAYFQARGTHQFAPIVNATLPPNLPVPDATDVRVAKAIAKLFDPSTRAAASMISSLSLVEKLEKASGTGPSSTSSNSITAAASSSTSGGGMEGGDPAQGFSTVANQGSIGMLQPTDTMMANEGGSSVAVFVEDDDVEVEGEHVWAQPIVEEDD